MPILVIAAYHCEVAGEPTESVDYQVRHFASDSIDEVMTRLRAEQPQTYRNVAGQEVKWIFDDTVAVEFDPEFKDGAEVIGFITENRKKSPNKMVQATAAAPVGSMSIGEHSPYEQNLHLLSLLCIGVTGCWFQAPRMPPSTGSLGKYKFSSRAELNAFNAEMIEWLSQRGYTPCTNETYDAVVGRDEWKMPGVLLSHRYDSPVRSGYSSPIVTKWMRISRSSDTTWPCRACWRRSTSIERTLRPSSWSCRSGSRPLGNTQQATRNKTVQRRGARRFVPTAIPRHRRLALLAERRVRSTRLQ